jgi:glutaminyl-peptide cyclotransferase
MSAKKRAAKQMNQGAEARRVRVEPERAPVATPPPKSKKSLLITIVLGLLALLVLWSLYKKLNPTPPTPLPPKPMELEKQWQSTVDGARMWDMLKAFLAIGPRVAGTPGSEAAQQRIKAELGAAGITDVREQKFTAKTPEGPVNFTNVIGVLPGKNREGIAIAAHYDSKLFKEFNFVGANDAASAVVVVFELARKLKAAGADRDITYYFIFFDGEEAFRLDWRSWEREPGGDLDHTYGSRHFVKKMEEEKYAVKALVLLDLVGDKDYSLVDYPTDFSPELTAIFKNASIQTFGVNFFTQTPSDLEDDYVPFMAEKIPVIDIIDFQYGPSGLEYWHTPEDTIDKLDQRSLERTGTLVLAALPHVEKMVAKGLQVSGSGGAPAKKTVDFGAPETQTSSGTTTKPK